MRCPRKGLAIRRVAALRSALCSLLSLSPLATLQTAARLRHHDRGNVAFIIRLSALRRRDSRRHVQDTTELGAIAFSGRRTHEGGRTKTLCCVVRCVTVVVGREGARS